MPHRSCSRRSCGLAAPARAQTLAITGATIIDGTGNAPLSDGVVLISDGWIPAVGGSRDVAIPDAARRLDARGKYVIPGLMDLNVHLFLNIDLETLIKYEDRYHEIVLEAAQITLKNGVTTVFDTWGPRAALVKVRDMINAGEAPGSRIYLAGNNHWLWRAIVRRFQRPSGPACQQGLRQPHQRDVGAGHGAQADVDDPGAGALGRKGSVVRTWLGAAVAAVDRAYDFPFPDSGGPP